MRCGSLRADPRRVRLTVATLGAMVLLLTSGCGQEGPDPDAEPTDTQASAKGEDPSAQLADPQKAKDLFADFQDMASEVTGFKAEGSTTVQGQTQQAQVEFDAQNESFEGTVNVSGEGLDIGLEIIRANELTWVKGPAEYWQSLGYPAHGAEVAQGKYVVFEMNAGDAVADPYNYAQLLEQTTTVAMDEVTVESIQESSDADVYRYVLGEDEDSPWLELPVNGDLESARYVSASDSAEADVRFWDFGADVDVQAPPPDQVLSSMEDRAR